MIKFSPIASAVDDNKEEAVFFVKRADVGISPYARNKNNYKKKVNGIDKGVEYNE